jgi:signal transduction histidine kinase
VIGEPEPDSGRCLTEVRDDQRRVVAIVHDVALRDDSAFIEAAASASSVAFATDRVAVRTGRMVRELTESRARILAAADGERRRIERDLHDGAQQRLVALCIHLELAAESVDGEHPEEAAALRELVGEVDQALEEMRSLTHGIYPAVLLDHGLAEALRSAARRCPVPTTVEAPELGDYTDELVTAVYFCCIEALQNVAKHAPGAGSARIVLRETDSVLRFSVSDDGPGIDDVDAAMGAGMMNMHDRMTTAGGELRVESRPGHGTQVIGKVPVAAAPAAAAGGQTGDGSRVLPA